MQVTPEQFTTDISIDIVIKEAIVEHAGVLGTLLTVPSIRQGQFDAAFRQGRTLGAGFAPADTVSLCDDS